MTHKIQKTIFSWLCTFPALLLIGLIIVFPILYTAYISFTNMNVFNWFDFQIIGFRNYINALFVFDTGFLRALWITIFWTALNMAFQLSIAFIMASLLNYKKLTLRKVYKTLLMFPWAMPGYVSILIWRNGMFNSQFGLLNQWMERLGFEPVRWLAGDVTAFLSSMVVNLWLALPFMIMIMDGALQSVDRTYYESAILEGASWYTRSVRLTVPAISPIIGPAVIITLFTTFKQFDVIYLLIQQVGNKSGANIHTVLTYAYENAFVTNNFGFSSAISMIIFLLLIGMAMMTIFRPKRRELSG